MIRTLFPFLVAFPIRSSAQLFHRDTVWFENANERIEFHRSDSTFTRHTGTIAHPDVRTVRSGRFQVKEARVVLLGTNHAVHRRYHLKSRPIPGPTDMIRYRDELRRGPFRKLKAMEVRSVPVW